MPGGGASKGILIAVVCLLLLGTACSSKCEKKKFIRAHQAAMAVERAIVARMGYQEFGAVLQSMSNEVKALEITVRSEEERSLLRDYENLLAMYREGRLLEKYRIEFARYGFVPRGLIYVGQDVEPIAIKYRIPMEPHVYEPTGQAWKSIPEDSINIVWGNARSQLKIIDNILNY
jgi:hypothetical protein